jgi:hypothetical protein
MRNKYFEECLRNEEKFKMLKKEAISKGIDPYLLYEIKHNMAVANMSLYGKIECIEDMSLENLDKSSIDFIETIDQLDYSRFKQIEIVMQNMH